METEEAGKAKNLPEKLGGQNLALRSPPSDIFSEGGPNGLGWSSKLHGFLACVLIWCCFVAFCFDLVPFCCVLHRFGPVLLRSASIWCRFAAFCLDLMLFCCVLHRFGAVLLRSASIWRCFAPFCIDLVPFCCVLHRFRTVLLRSAWIWFRFAAFLHR